MSKIKVIAGETFKDFTTALIASYFKRYKKKIGCQKKYTRFADNEFKSLPGESVREKRVFIVQSTFMPLDNLFELLMLIDAAKRASAYKVTVVIPYLGFARQDRKDESRSPITARLIADMIEAAGADRLITMDLHADQIQGFFKIPVDHLYASTLFIPYIKSLGLSDLVIATPDLGGSKRANSYRKFLKEYDPTIKLVFGYKDRKQANEVDYLEVLGDVKGKNVILIDDIIDTAGTLIKAADVMKKKGALSVRAVVTHPLLSGPAYERIEKSSFEEIVVTDTIPLRQKSSKIKVLTATNIFAEVIYKGYVGGSISTSFL